MRIAAIVLAAGSSQRLGQPKQDVRLGTETLLERTIRIANLAQLSPVYVVVQPGRTLPRESAGTLLINPNAAEGMASSIRTGVGTASQNGVDGVILLACDQPTVTAAHLRTLVGDGEVVVASSYAGRSGVPAYFPASAFGALMEIRGDTGARGLVKDAPTVELLHGELDIDTINDLAHVGELFPSGLPG